MYFEGTAKVDKRTKNLVKRLTLKDIAVIDHRDLDRVSAESLVEKGIGVVINANTSITGKYPNLGPLVLCSHGVHLIDEVGSEIMKQIKDKDYITVKDNIIMKNGKVIAKGKVLSYDDVLRTMEEAKLKVGAEIEKFVTNTAYFLEKEKKFLLEGIGVPETKIDLRGRQVLVVVRGYDYKEDLKTLAPYIREKRPILIGVDGGADALLGGRYKPHIIIGDMDSVSDEALRCGAEIIVHAYEDGTSPGLERLKSLNLDYKVFQSLGTSEDIALLLAYENGADLIVAVGTHTNLIEFLDKGRKGMSSTFLVRLRVGSILVDAKGVSKLYPISVKLSYLFMLIISALVAITIAISVSPTLRNFFKLLFFTIRSKLKI